MLSIKQIKRELSGGDGHEHMDKLAIVTKRLMATGLLSLSDIIEQGGWCASVNKRGNVFFIYGGGFRVSNKIYYDADTGKLTDGTGNPIEAGAKDKTNEAI